MWSGNRAPVRMASPFMPQDPSQPRIPILLMSHSLGHGGGERQLALTAQSLDRGRFEPHIACCHGGFRADQLREAGVPFFFIGSRSLMSAAAVREALRLRRYIREHGIRIVQTFDYSMNVFGIPVAASIPGVIPISNQRCHMDLIPARYRWLNAVAHRISPAVVVNSEELGRDLQRDYGIPERRIFTCYNGVDTDVFHAGPRRRLAGLEDAALVLGTLCVLRPEKNIQMLLDAFRIVSGSRPGVRLLIVGSGPEEPALRERAERLGVADDCLFLPSTSEVAAALASMDIFVLPSLTEGLSNALMEAMASGCCVLASRVGGNPELVTDGETGFLFESNVAESLAEKLGVVLDNGEMRARMADAGARRMAAEFSTGQSARRMQKIYEMMLEEVSVRP